MKRILTSFSLILSLSSSLCAADHPLSAAAASSGGGSSGAASIPLSRTETVSIATAEATIAAAEAAVTEASYVVAKFILNRFLTDIGTSAHLKAAMLVVLREAASIGCCATLRETAFRGFAPVYSVVLLGTPAEHDAWNEAHRGAAAPAEAAAVTVLRKAREAAAAKEAAAASATAAWRTGRDDDELYE